MKKIILPLLVLVALATNLKAQNFHITEDFNASALPSGWSNTAISGSAVWNFGIDGAFIHDNPNDPNQNLDGTPFAYFDDDALGLSSSDNTVELKTPSFNNASNLVTTLEFDYNVRFYNTIPDSFYVEVFDGLNWVVVFSRSQDDCGSYITSPCTNGIPHAVVDISAYANANCQVRFTYFDGNSTVDWGWYVGIDNVEIYSPFPNDLQVSNITRPVSSCGLTAADTVEVVIKNIGTLAASNFGVAYSINGGVAVNETVTATILPNDSLVYKFNTTANFSTIGNYTIDAYSNLTTDGNVANDTTTVSIDNDPIFTPTYTEDFEGASTGWITYGVNSSWQLGVPPAPLPYINTAASGQKAWVTKLTGLYNLNEMSYLESPCFDFSSSIGDPIISFSLIYQIESNHPTNPFDKLWMESSFDNGVTWTKVQGAAVASNWYNFNTIDVWSDVSGGWINVENVLVGFAGQPQVKLRFAFSTDGGTQMEGVGVDKFTIRNPQAIDLSMNSLMYPSASNAPECGYGSSENIIVQLENKGANPINSYTVSYQVDNGTVFTETVNAVLPPSSRLNYTFTNKFNFSALRNYNLRIWANAAGDGFTANDTIENIIVRNTQSVNPASIPFFEDFNAFPVPGFINNWVENSAGFYDWETENGGTPNSTNTGPVGDHDGNGQHGNGVYVYTEASSAGPDANLISPCIDLSNNSGAKLIFWYHMFGSEMGNLFVDVYDGNGWVTGVDRINGQVQTAESDPWLEREVSLNAYAGRRIKLRFRGVHSGQVWEGDISIDDVQIIEPLPKDANLLGPVSPEAGCDISGNSTVAVEVNNFGTLTIMPDSMFMYYQIDQLPPVKDTFDQILPTDQTTTFTFTQTADFSVRGKKYNLKTWVELPGDPNFYNDTVYNYQIINQTRGPNFKEDMETFRDAACDDMLGQVVENGWHAEEGQYVWHVQKARCGQGDLVTPTANTGPNGDHTTANGTGYFIYTDASAFTTGSTVARFYSPCLDLTNESAAAMNFWYHKYGNQMGNLSVQADTGTGWINLLTISGQTQTSAGAQWKLATVDLTPFVGNLMQIRFSGSNGGTRGNMAIDDIFIYRPSTVDVGVTEINSPSGDNCNLPSTAPVTIKVKNFGSQTLAANTVQVKYTNNNAQLQIDTIPQAIAAGAEVTYTFATNMDLTGVGEQIVRVSATTNGDTLTDNNGIERLVVNRKVGLPYYFQNFERFELGANGYNQDDLKSWSRSPNGSGHTWHAWQGPGPMVGGEPMPAPPIPPNGPSGDHTFASDRRNGDGIYMLTETKFRNQPNLPDAWLKMACTNTNIDLSNSTNGRILLSFWYHMFGGNTGDLFVDVHNGTQWVNGVSVIRGVQMQKATDAWREWQVNLDNFAGVSNAQIRFRADYIQGGNGAGGGDIGIDDVSILDRATYDLTAKKLVDPESDCNLSNRERLRVQVQNTGTQDVLQVNMGYQMTHTGLDNVVTVYPPVHDALIGVLIVPSARYTFEFTNNNRPDMSLPGKYALKIWTENANDAYAFNDTLYEVIENTTNPFPSCVDFSRLTYGDKGPDYQDELLPNNWISSQGASYAWTASMDGPEDTGGPTYGNTSGVNDLYMLLEGGMPGQTAWIQSNCFDLTSTRAANLQFFYQATSPNHVMFVQIRVAGGAWRDLDTLRGFGINSVASWQKAEFVLADYLGNFVEFRFFAIQPGGGYYAIDDICVVRPPNQQIELEQIFRPRTGLCYYSDAETFTIRTQNVGNDEIDSFRVILAVDTSVQKVPLGQYQRDTFWFYPTVPAFEPGLKLDFDLDSTVDMSYYTRYYISVMLFLPGDIDTTNNRLINVEYVHGDPRDLPYLVDFEDPVDPLNGMTVLNGAFYAWSIEQGLVNYYRGLTGPSFDHTLQNSNGTYITSLSAAGNQGDAIAILSECIDLQNTISPEMSYWYHMFSADGSMGDLYLQIDDDFGWVNVDSVRGPDPDQIRNTSAWKERKVDLSQYAGDVVKFRFVSLRGSSEGSNMALDDISIYDLAPSDAAAHSLIRPNEDRSSCYTDTQTVKVGVRNNGSLPIDFDIDTLEIQVNIKKDGLPWDTLNRTVSTDVFRSKIPPFSLIDLPKDSVAIIEMDGNFDMSDIGSTFEFETVLNFYPDLITSNDIRIDTVVARRDSGVIIVDDILPNDTVCYGTAVQLKLEDYFGAITWQEKLLDANGNGFWLDGFILANDSVYTVLLDSTSEIRADICRQTQSLPVTVEITKPYQGRALNNSRCGTGALSLGLITPSNIDRVNIYRTDTSTAAYISLTSSTTLPSGELQWDFVDNFKINSQGFDTTYVMYAETIIDSCSSPFLLPIYASVNRLPGRTTFPGVSRYDTVCQDTSIVLNAGGQPGRRYTYDWTITYPDGKVFKDSVQTIVVDAWRLSKDSTYKYSVIVTSDSGCVNLDGSGNPIPMEADIFVADSCVTGLADYKFGDEFAIFPNPTNNDLYVEYRSLQSLSGRVSLLSMEGKLIEEQIDVDFTSNRMKFNLGSLPKGIYFIRIETDKGSIVRKVIRS